MFTLLAWLCCQAATELRLAATWEFSSIVEAAAVVGPFGVALHGNYICLVKA